MADEQVRIEFQVTGLARAAQEAKAFKEELKGATAAKKEAEKPAATTSGKAPNIGRGATPWDRLTQAQSEYDKSQTRGNLYRLRIAEQATARAEKLISPSRPNMMQRLGKVAETSRFGAGAVSPLVGQTLEAIAPEAAGMAGPILAAVGAVALLGHVAKQTADMIGEHSSTKWAMGGSAQAAGQSAFIGSMMGMGPGETAGNMRGAMERIASDNLARNFAGQYGVRNMGTWDDPTKEPEKYRKLVRAIATDPDEKRAIRAARRFGMEEALKFRDLSPVQREIALNLGIGEQDSFGTNASRNKATIDMASGLASTAYDAVRAKLLNFGMWMLHVPGGGDDDSKPANGAKSASAGNQMRRAAEGSYGANGDYMPSAVSAGGAFAYQNHAWDGSAFTYGAFW